MLSNTSDAIAILYSKNIANIATISQKHINNLLHKYNKIETIVANILVSRYSNIDNYTSYVYGVHDTLLDKWYIGVRYGIERFSNDCLLDLLKYQTSSTDTEFKKLLKTDILSNGNRFILHIIREFDNEFLAINYEALLHQIFDVGYNLITNSYNSLFYNRTTEIFKEYKVYSTIYFDLQTNQELTYKNMILLEDITYNVLYSLALNKVLINNYRFCSLDNKEKAMKEYTDKYYSIRNIPTPMYVLNNYGWGYKTTPKLISEWALCLQDDNIYQLIYDTTRYIKNHYYKYEYFEQALKQYRKIKLYIINLEDGSYTIQTETYRYWLNLLGTAFNRMMSLNHSISSVKGHYYDYDKFKEALLDYKIETLYTCKNRIIQSISNTRKGWKQQSIAYHSIIKGKSNMITINNKQYYISYDVCLENHLEYTLLHEKTNKYITILRKDGKGIIGSNFYSLIRGKYSNINGYILIPYNLI